MIASMFSSIFLLVSFIDWMVTRSSSLSQDSLLGLEGLQSVFSSVQLGPHHFEFLLDDVLLVFADANHVGLHAVGG